MIHMIQNGLSTPHTQHSIYLRNKKKKKKSKKAKTIELRKSTHSEKRYGNTQTQMNTMKQKKNMKSQSKKACGTKEPILMLGFIVVEWRVREQSGKECMCERVCVSYENVFVR